MQSGSHIHVTNLFLSFLLILMKKNRNRAGYLCAGEIQPTPKLKFLDRFFNTTTSTIVSIYWLLLFQEIRGKFDILNTWIMFRCTATYSFERRRCLWTPPSAQPPTPYACFYLPLQNKIFLRTRWSIRNFSQWMNLSLPIPSVKVNE